MDINISVIVPVYKVEKYLDKCVESLLNQDYGSYEIILVDDGSPDNCPKLCDDYDRKHTVIRSLHKTNGGLGDARNFGVQNSYGKYIAFVDSDDYVEPSYLSNMWKLISEFDADLCITRIKRENPDEKKHPLDSGDKCCISGGEAIFEVYKHEELGWSACGKLFRKDLVLENPFPKGYYEDSAVMYKILDACKLVAIGNYLYNYHYINHEGSILQSRLSQKHYRIFDICDEFEGFIKTNYPQYYSVTVIFKRAAITQMLNCQRMGWQDYKKIVYKYRKQFRNNWIRIMLNKRISTTNKMYLTLYCTFPIVVKTVEEYKRGQIKNNE